MLSRGERAHQALTGIAFVIAALLFVRLGGTGRDWLPSAPALAGAVVLALFLRSLVRAGRARSPGTFAWRDWLERQHFTLGLTCIMAMTLVIRLPHINADLGHVPIDIDEFRLASNVRDYFITGRVGYETVEHYPGIAFWLIAGASLLTYLRGLLDGSFGLEMMPVDNFAASGRLVSAWLAVGIVACTALLGRHLAGTAAGLIAAGVVAAVRLSVDTTTMVRNDTAQVFFIVLAVYVAFIARGSERWVTVLAAGTLAGVATAIKYTSVFALIPVLLAVWLNRPHSMRVSRLGIAILGFALAVAVTNHFVWFDVPNFLHQISAQVVEVSRVGQSENPAAYHVDILATFGPGWPLLLLAMGYGVWGLGTGRPEAWIFWSFPLVYSWFTTQSLIQFSRWVLPLLPFVAIAGAAGLTAIVRTITAWNGWSRHAYAWALRPAAGALVIVVALATPVWAGAVNFSRRWAMPTHEIVERYINERAAGQLVLIENGQLVFDKTVRTYRVPRLRSVLGGGLYERLVGDWIVVSEFDTGAARGLRGLQFELRVVAGQDFGGNTGLDYDIYSTVKLARATRGEDLRLTDEAAALMLGHEWDEYERKAPGLPLPPAGASLFLPPVAWDDVRLEFDVDVAAVDTQTIPIALDVDGVRVPWTNVSRAGTSTRLEGVAHLVDPGRVTTLRLTPQGATAGIRVVRFAFDQPRH